MARATDQFGRLAILQRCYIDTPCGRICLRILPEITDSKSANYIPENIPGRSSPVITYAFSDARQISTELHFMTTTSEDIQTNLKYLKILQSLVYPRDLSGAAPFVPPPTVRFVCGELMDGTNGVCLILRSYSVRYPTEVSWDEETYLPYKFSVSCNWEVVYACKNLPVNKCINLESTAPFIG